MYCILNASAEKNGRQMPFYSAIQASGSKHLIYIQWLQGFLREELYFCDVENSRYALKVVLDAKLVDVSVVNPKGRKWYAVSSPGPNRWSGSVGRAKGNRRKIAAFISSQNKAHCVRPRTRGLEHQGDVSVSGRAPRSGIAICGVVVRIDVDNWPITIVGTEGNVLGADGRIAGLIVGVD